MEVEAPLSNFAAELRGRIVEHKVELGLAFRVTAAALAALALAQSLDPALPL